MKVTVAQIAKTLAVSEDQALELLREQGITVSDGTTALSDSDLKKLREAIAQAKRQRASQQDASTLAERAKSHLEYCLANHKVFIDTCSLLHFAADKFWTHAAPLLEQSGNKIIIPTRVIDELRKHSDNENDPELAKKATLTLENISKLLQAQLVELRGEETDNFADNVFFVVFAKHRLTQRLLLITQDANLARDILDLNNSKSTRANRVYVKRITRFGYLSDFRTGNPANLRSQRTATTKVESVPSAEKFPLSKNITSVPDEVIPVSNIPSTGDTVYARRGENFAPLQLTEAIASGGEGTIYRTSTASVAKIYKTVTRRRREKIQLMLSKPFDCEGICYPTAALYNCDEQFVGFLMPEARGKELQKSLFIKPLLLKNFPHWKKRDTVELCITILEKIKYLHDRNIIMGDINPANILVVSPKEVYFVDTDSYQIGGFPCPVGTINYTAPEIQRKSFDSFLRTFGNEYFAVATLLFMIMLPGKPPYSQQGGENPIDNIIRMDFSYPLGEQSNKKTPEGPWRFIWSHLTYDIKSAFYHTFAKDGDYSAEADRLSASDWLVKFRRYLDLLDSGKLGQQDKMSEELFPIRFKLNPNVTYVNCVLCGVAVPEESCKENICPQCLNTGEVHTCERCGKEMLFTNYLKYIKKAKPYAYCPECYAYRNEIHSALYCIDCGSEFTITNGTYEYYVDRAFDLPKRCPDCRQARRHYVSLSTYTSVYNVTRKPRKVRLSPPPPPQPKVRRGCFITTVVCEHLGKADDGYELTTLRWYRDNWLQAQPGGKQLIAEYYALAPQIVERLSVSPRKGEICAELWQQYLAPCIGLIEAGDFVACKETYMAMVKHLDELLAM